jgi:hypothetical protein
MLKRSHFCSSDTSFSSLASIHVTVSWILCLSSSSACDYLNTLCLALKRGSKNVTDILLWLMFSKHKSPTIIHVAVMAHHTSIFWLWRGTSQVCLRLLLLQYVLFWALIYPHWCNQASSVKKCKFWIENIVMYCPQKTVTTIHSSLIIIKF